MHLIHILFRKYLNTFSANILDFWPHKNSSSWIFMGQSSTHGSKKMWIYVSWLSNEYAIMRCWLKWLKFRRSLSARNILKCSPSKCSEMLGTLERNAPKTLFSTSDRTRSKPPCLSESFLIMLAKLNPWVEVEKVKTQSWHSNFCGILLAK